MFYPKSVESFAAVVKAARRHFGVSESEALNHLLQVLWLSQRVTRPHPPQPTSDGDIVITCELCDTEQWWRDNYGSLWEWARWWHCGPFGLNCSGA